MSETSLVSNWPVVRSPGLTFPPKSSSSLAIFTRISLTSSPMYIPLIIFSNLQGYRPNNEEQSLLCTNSQLARGGNMHAREAGAHCGADLCGIAETKMCRDLTAQGRLQGRRRLLHLCRPVGLQLWRGRAFSSQTKHPRDAEHCGTA